MIDIDKELKKNLHNEVDINFTNDTMKLIKTRVKRIRILFVILLMVLSSVIITLIPFENLQIKSLPYIDYTLVINKLYVFIIFTFTIIILLDSVIRSILDSNQFTNKN